MQAKNEREMEIVKSGKRKERENNWKHAPFKRSLEKLNLIQFQWVLCRCRDVDGITDETKHQFKTKMIQKKCDNVWKIWVKIENNFFIHQLDLQCNGSYEGVSTCIIECHRMAWMIVISRRRWVDILYSRKNKF